MSSRRLLSVPLLVFALILTFHDASAAPDRRLSRDAVLDKIRGGWAGQMIGVAYGAPTEFRSNGKILEGPLAWKAGMLENTIHQDDLYVEMTFAAVMDRVGLKATSRDYGRAFRDSIERKGRLAAGGARRPRLFLRSPP